MPFEIENDFTGRGRSRTLNIREEVLEILFPNLLFMTEENVLQLELEKLDLQGLKRVAQVWNISGIGKDKKSCINKIIEGMCNEFYLKGILEKLSSTQVTIYTSIIQSKDKTLTLGEIARKISMPPVNAEMELGVLKRYFLIYQRKNRERLTNNLDKYYYYPESGNILQIESNEKGQKFRISLETYLQQKTELPDFWRRKFNLKKTDALKIAPNSLPIISQDDTIAELLEQFSELEKQIVTECFLQGGILEISRARDVVTGKKGKWEDIVGKLHSHCLLIDDYYVDEKFIRLLIIPPEIFSYLERFPITPPQKKGTRRRQEKKTTNELDFFLNLKKLIVYINRRGLNLAKSGKIKQADLRETETRLLKPDISLFIEKSEIYQIELLLPIMRLLDIVRVKRDDVVLRNDYDKILKMKLFELMDRVVKTIMEARSRRIRYEDVFEPLYVPFFAKDIFGECVDYIYKAEEAFYFVVVSVLIRSRLVLSKNFRIKDFQQELNDLRREIHSVLFYLQLLGFMDVEYPDRKIAISELGLSYLRSKTLVREDMKGGVIINPDLSLIAIPEKLSLTSLSILKSFLELKNFDNIYTFQLTRESFQEGLLLKNSKETLLDLLRQTSKGDLSQNLLFLTDDWSQALPIVTITDECVVLQTADPKHMELLLGQIAGKKIVHEEISSTTILIHAEKIYETITYAEKLNLIVNLIR